MFSFFAGCVTDSKSKDKEPAGEARKPRTPKVAYQAFDSLVEITITGSKPDEEDAYWIYRDGKLLEPPVHVASGGGADLYILRDSLSEAGVHAYTVRYGTHPDSLSDKSPEYLYNYTGHSRSGWVSLSAGPEQQVAVAIRPPLDGLLSEIIVQRRIGSRGNVIALDTLEAGRDVYLDTSLVAEDAYLYYRIRAVDALTDSLLAPSPWDSILVKNKVWKYLPAVTVLVSRAEVEVAVANPQEFAGHPGGTGYYLYRNEVSARPGAVKVDSATAAGGLQAPTLRDMPDSGDYYYWVEARDPWGRASVRSVPRAVRFTGKAKGPDVAYLTTGSASIQVQPVGDEDARLYILQRVQDTTKAAVSVDTLPLPTYFPFSITFTDRPTADGYYYYRFVTLDENGRRSDPGTWRRTEFYHYSPVYGTLSVAIVNRGDHVQAGIDRYPGYYFVLYRSKSASATAADTLAVDTLAYQDTGSALTDVPGVGAWYYRVYRVPEGNSGDGEISRSAAIRIDFTGKPVGPAVLSLSVGPTRVDIGILPDPDALAYILERSGDGKEWAVADTVSAKDGQSGLLGDRPPKDGYWEYRVRAVRKDLSPTGPGTSMRTPVAFAFGPAYSNTLTAIITNKGAVVECPNYASYAYVFYLMRSPTPDMSKGARVDSMRFPSSIDALRDAPPKGTYYYWLQREPEFREDVIYRSLPVKIEFTGSPEITSIAKAAGGIQINYPAVSYGDTLEIHRSSGKPEDLSSYERVAAREFNTYSSYYIDTGVAGKPGFYHYRLAIRSGGKVSDLGGAKSIYYEP